MLSLATLVRVMLHHEFEHNATACTLTDNSTDCSYRLFLAHDQIKIMFNLWFYATTGHKSL
jgi:hypothetical protein